MSEYEPVPGSFYKVMEYTDFTDVDKCKVLSIGFWNTTDFTDYLGDVNDRIELEKDLVVIIDCRL